MRGTHRQGGLEIDALLLPRARLVHHVHCTMRREEEGGSFGGS